MTVLLSTLAALGAFALLWLTLGLALCPAGEACAVVVTLCPQGEAEGLEQTLRALGWLQDTGLLHAQLRLRDAELSDAGRARLRRALGDRLIANSISFTE